MGALEKDHQSGHVRLSLVRHMLRALHAAARVAWGPQRVYVVLWALALFTIMFALRGGLTPSPPEQNWPWPVGSVHTGWTNEPYLFVVIHPRWLLTLQAYTMLRWAGLAGIVAWGAGLLRYSACCVAGDQSRRGWAPGVLGGLLGITGAATCCGTALPVLTGLAGLSTLSPAIDWLMAVGMTALILIRGRALTR